MSENVAHILSIDLGGTQMRAALYQAGDFVQVTRVATLTYSEQGATAIIARLIDLARTALPDGITPSAIGIAAPGPLDPRTGVVMHSFALPGWDHVPLGAQISAAFGGVSVALENDANCAALAEYALGAGRQADPLIYLTLSTGIGGGVVFNGRLFTGWSGLAAEPGHMQFTDQAGVVRRLEELASGTGIARLATERLPHYSGETALRGLPTRDGAAVGNAAVAGDAFALEVVRLAGTYLGLGLVNLFHVWSPQAVILGGSVTQLGDLLLDVVRQTVHDRILNPLFIPPNWLRLAQFGSDVCLLGAAVNAAQHFTKSPSRSFSQ
jgi:glucokinase